MTPRRKRFGQRLKGWQTLAAAGVAFVAALTVTFLGLIKPGLDGPAVSPSASPIVPAARPSVAVSSVSLFTNSEGDRIVEVKGKFAGLRFSDGLTIYAVARPSDGQPVGGLVPEELRPSAGSGTTKRWYVSEAISAGGSDLWQTEIVIDKTEKRPLSVQAIMAPGCPLILGSCDTSDARTKLRLYTQGPSPDESATAPKEVRP
jgi:hypothetical protein